MEQRPNLFVVDIDGCICEYDERVFRDGQPMKMLPGSLEKLKEWRARGDIILLTTGRDASREVTERQLEEAGVPYDGLVMGVGGGVRHLINDTKLDGTITAIAHPLARNEGLSSIL